MRLLRAWLSAVALVATFTIAWDQAGPSLATVQSYTYRMTVNEGAGSTYLAPVSCTGTASPYTCSVLLDPFADGTYRIQLSTTDGDLESPRSAELQVTFKAGIVTAWYELTPKNLRLP